MIVIDTPDAMAHMRHAQFIAMLRIEVRTGMVHSRGSVMNLAREEFGIIQRTKKGVLAVLEQKYEETYGRKYGS